MEDKKTERRVIKKDHELSEKPSKPWPIQVQPAQSESPKKEKK